MSAETKRLVREVIKHVALEAIIERVKTGAQGSLVQALVALSDIEQLALAALQQEDRPDA
jgi:hypothetical protein